MNVVVDTTKGEMYIAADFIEKAGEKNNKYRNPWWKCQN